jgi:hypothetical protein
VYSFSPPYIHKSVSDHTRITAGTRCTKRVCMVNIELPCATLDHKPRFVRGGNRAGSVEFCDVQGTSLRSWWCRGNLQIEYNGKNLVGFHAVRVMVGISW